VPDHAPAHRSRSLRGDRRCCGGGYGNGPLLALTVVLLAAEAILTAALYTIGVSFAIVIPLIGIGIVQPYLRGAATKAVYVGAGVVATISGAVFALDIQPNPLSQPGLAVIGFAFLAAFALGLVWRAGDRWIEALDAADNEIAARRGRAELGHDPPPRDARVVLAGGDDDGRRRRDGQHMEPRRRSLFGAPASEVLGRPSGSAS
jgi:hypothetical protein